MKLIQGVRVVEVSPPRNCRECEARSAVRAPRDDASIRFITVPWPSTLIAQEAAVDDAQVTVRQRSPAARAVCMLMEPGDVAHAEEPSCDRTLTVLQRVGARVVGFPLEDYGPDDSPSAAVR